MKNCLTPKNPKMCDPILVTLLKMRPHYRQSSRENATPSSGTSPLTSYKKVLPPPTPGCLGAFGCRLRVWSKWETTCRFLPALSEVLNADFGQRTKDIWKLRDISISPFIPLRKGGENLGFSWNNTLWTIICFSWLSRAWYFHACLYQRCKLWQTMKMNL